MAPSKSYIFAALSAVLLSGLACRALAGPGDLDLSFGGTGRVRTGFGFGDDHARAVAVQADRKLIVAGSSGGFQNVGSSFSLLRLDTNNLPDPAFGFGGRVITPVSAEGLGFAQADVSAVRIQVDGKIVAAGFAYTRSNHSDFTLVRYNPNGSLDQTFGTNGTGIVFTDLGDGSEIHAMAIQADGRIVVAGYTTGHGAVALARYQTNGTLDLSFGNGGTQLTTGVNGYTGAHALVLQPDGKILAAGIGIGAGHGGIDFALYRYTASGFLDSEFGGGSGKVFTAITTNVSTFNYFDTAEAVAIQPGNNTPQNPDKIVVAGTYDNFEFLGDSMIALARYKLDGTLDSTFGNGGIVTNTVLPGSTYGRAIMLQGAGIQPRKIVVAGYNVSAGRSRFVAARYNANGSPDTTFNGNGVALTAVGPSLDEASGIASQGGKIVVVGSTLANENNTDFAIARYNSDGSPDTSLSTNGTAAFGVADRPAPAKGVALQKDGKVVAVGYAENGTHDVFALARFNVDGSPDNAFGVNGKVTTSFGAGNARASAVAIQPGGEIIAAGYVNDDIALVRYDTNGVPDPSFGVNGSGVVTTSISTGSDQANAITLQPDGRIVVAGSSHNGANADFALMRYTTNGIPDLSFSGDGKVTTAIGTSDDVASAVKMQPDGKIVVAGTTVIGAGYDFAVVRYNTNGTLDNSFGSFGRVVTDIADGSFDLGQSLAIQPDGRILVAGSSIKGPVFFALARYTTNGTLDSSFDGDGKLTTQIGLGLDFAFGLALQNDNKMVVAGASTSGEAQFAAIRYYVDGSLDRSYGEEGKAVVIFEDDADNTGYALALDSFGRAVIAGDAGGIFGVARLQGDPFLGIRSVARRSDGQVVLEGVGLPGSPHTIQVSSDASPSSFAPLDTVTPDGEGLWRYQDAGASGSARRFYRLSLP